MNVLISTEDLMKATGYKTAGHIESWLQKNHIPYFCGKEGNIITTIDKINDALDGEKKQMKSIEFGHGSET
jgi:hypothetical protein